MCAGGRGHRPRTQAHVEKWSAMNSKQRDPNPNKNSLIRKQCCKRQMESLIQIEISSTD